MNVVFNKKSRLFIKGNWIAPKKNTAVSILIKIILVYSAIKINVNVPALYSVLNPETSSDSPSAKSKGVRFVSARVVANHVRNEGIRRRITHEELVRRIWVRSNLKNSINTPRRINAILTS
jgi:hypothetical protein